MMMFKLFIVACLSGPVEPNGYSTECRAFNFKVYAMNQHMCEGITAEEQGINPRAIKIYVKCTRYFDA